ncbi:hypothetical protein [Halocatena salina]|uniref:Uncharacterized protein n=1 Tax=Halocatena salina TaxID=2934340 RepID=A0A8U0A5Z5_9EURY|nr:hypothetical protein [Halocatena salina]UPM44492.1 hypothetical protein MW046_13705 [Halocatena salina]
MVLKRWTSVLLHNLIFWVALALFGGGLLVPESVVIRTGGLSVGIVPEAVSVAMIGVRFGGLLIVGRIVVSILLLMYREGRYGYAKGRH